MSKKGLTKKNIILLSLLFAVLLVLNVIAWSPFEAPKSSEPDPDFVAQYEWTLPLSEEYKLIEEVKGAENRFLAIGPTDYDFSGLGILTVQPATSYGVIDCYGNVIIPFQFENIKADSSNGLYVFGGSYAQPETIMLYGLLDDSGEVVLSPRYEILMPYIGKHAIGMREDCWEVIDEAGNVVYTSNERLHASEYHDVFRFVRDEVAYLVNITNGEEIVFEGYEYMPWDVSRIENDETTPAYEVVYHNGLYGIIEAEE